MTKNDTISIAVASDNFYAILIAALLKSIDLNHKSGEHIDFYIIDDGISSKAKKRIQTIADPSRITIIWVTGKQLIPENMHIPVDTSGFPLTTYLRIFVPYLAGARLDKILYLDVDIILRDDVSKLWNMDIGDNIIGASQDVGLTFDCEWGGVPNYKSLGLAGDTKYFNAGVELINAKKWREENISTVVITALIEYKDHVRLGDQYGLNVALANKWQEMGPNWNWFAYKADEGAALIHFLDIKPIFDTYNSQESLKQEFFKYLDMTPWKGFKPISGRNRRIRKIYNKIKKTILRLTSKSRD